MGKIISDAKCPECAKTGHDSGSNHLLIFEDGGEHCPRAEYHLDGKPYTVRGSETANEYEEEELSSIEDIQALNSGSWPERKLSKVTLEHFGVKVAYDGSRNIEEVYRPVEIKGKTVAYKAKIKGVHNVGESLKGKAVDLFGQNKCTNFWTLYITEGEEDAMAIWETAKRKYPNKDFSVVAIRGSHVKAIQDNKEFIEKFKEVILCLDMDEAGKKGTQDICALLGPQKVWHISEKDANEMLKAGKTEELINALYSAKIEPPDGLLTIDDVWEEAVQMPKWGRLWPWPSLNKLTYGRRDGEGIYVGSAVKGGKTQFKDQMEEYIIREEKRKIFVCAFEQSPGVVVKGVAGKLAGKQFHNPEHVDQGKFTQEDLNEAVSELKDYMIIFKASFSDVGNGNMWDRLKPAIRHAVVVEGVKDVFIDPITQLTDGLNPSETETELRRFSNEIQGMAQDLGFFYYCFAHLKEPATGKTHEEGGDIKVAQFRGSRSMAEKTKFMLGIIRNQYAEEDHERNTSTFHLLLNSGFGKAGRFDVFYDDETGSYLEPIDEYKI